jgi:hypothetical protein
MSTALSGNDLTDVMVDLNRIATTAADISQISPIGSLRLQLSVDDNDHTSVFQQTLVNGGAGHYHVDVNALVILLHIIYYVYRKNVSNYLM